MRLFLEGGLVACGYGEMYARVTGDGATARQFERVREKMLTGLKAPAKRGQKEQEAAGDWQQLTLW